MKTFKLNHPLKRMQNENTLPFEKLICTQAWLVFDPEVMTETLSFYPNGTFVSQTKTSDAHGTHPSALVRGKWLYQGGDTFQFTFEGGVYGLHLVHLDTNLMIFELHDTKQYFILISKKCQQTINLNSLDEIDYYIGKLNAEFIERTQHPSTFNGIAPDIVPIMVMGGLFHSLPWFHDSDNDDTDVHLAKDVNRDEYDDEAEDDLRMDENEAYYEDDEFDDDEYVDTEYIDDEDENDNVYDDYTGLSEEEIIDDYLEDQDDY